MFISLVLCTLVFYQIDEYSFTTKSLLAVLTTPLVALFLCVLPFVAIYSVWERSGFDRLEISIILTTLFIVFIFSFYYIYFKQFRKYKGYKKVLFIKVMILYLLFILLYSLSIVS